MHKLAIVDDDPGYRKNIREFLKKYEEEYGTSFSINEFTDGDELLEGYKPDYDIILLDIEMEFVDGMTAAGRIREVDEDVLIIFITNMPQYAIKGYQVGALDYILKPLSYYAFSQTIKRAINRRQTTDKRYIVAGERGIKQKIDVSDILYVEVINHDLIFHTKNGNINARGTMRDTMNELAGMDFFQCNKGYLINLEYVDSVEGSDVRIGKDNLQVSRSKKKQLLDALNEYMRKIGH
ncbi:MAG: response regulator transcription factor [Butyrivibrio sp.]|nr:response regulator transcription factor [Butyrivibrio sp.]